MSVSQKENLLNYDVEYITSDKHEIKWWLDKLCEIRDTLQLGNGHTLVHCIFVIAVFCR